MFKPVLRIRIRSDPCLNKHPYRNFFGVCKSHKYFRNHCCLTFWIMNILFKAFSSRKLDKYLFRSRSGSGTKSGSGRFQKSDPYPVKNRPDPQHWFKHSFKI
jgi:hypothetical protein